MNRVGDSLRHWGPNEQLVSALVNARAEFLVIGGLAVAWYCEDRQADDMDILIKPTTENAERVCEALRTLPLERFYSAQQFASPGVQVKLVQHFYAEILTPRDNWPAFGEMYASSVDAKIYDIPIKIPSVGVLVQLKQIAMASELEAAEKHRCDIERLRKHVM